MTGSSLIFFKIHMKYVVYFCRIIKIWFHTDLGRENSASYYGHNLFTLFVQFLCCDWSKFDRWVHAVNLYCILKLVYFDIWRLQSVFVDLWCFLLSFSTGCIKWNTAAINSLLLFMAGLFIEFVVEKCAACQVGNPISDDIVFVFHLAGCWLKSPSSDSGLTWWLSGAASRMVSLSNYCICVCLFVFYI